MKKYEKTIEGRVVRLSAKNIVIKNGGFVTTNPTHEQILADGWVEYIAPPKPEPTAEELLARAKEAKKAEIEEYDKSPLVDGCYIIKGGQQMIYWADKSERDTLKGAVRDFITAGRETYRLDLREFGVSLTTPCEKLLEMLCALEVYAIDCFNNTTDHLYAVDAMTTVEEIESYDHTAGYPEKLTFNYE